MSLDLICTDKDEAEQWFIGLKALISCGHQRKWRTESRSDGIPSEANSSRTYTRSSPLNSPFGSGDSLQKNKVQELHKPFTEEGPTFIKDDAIVHAFGPERHGMVRGLGFVLEDAIESIVAWSTHFISFDFEEN